VAGHGPWPPSQPFEACALGSILGADPASRQGRVRGTEQDDLER
jgi:hypothetical protein